MPAVAKFTDQELITNCERFYADQGFVRWIDVAKLLGVSRQAVMLRVKKLVATGVVTEEDFKRWESLGSRATAEAKRKKENLKAKRKRERQTLMFRPKEENYEWLKYEAVRNQCSPNQILDALITKHRESLSSEVG